MTPSRMKLCLLAAAGALWTVAACEQPDAVMAPGTPARDPLPGSVYPNIILHNDLEQVLVLNEDPILTPVTETTTLGVRVPIRSVTEDTLFLKYRFRFYGPQREQTSRNPVWRSITIAPRTREIISANAIVMEAVGWELEIKRQ